MRWAGLVSWLLLAIAATGRLTAQCSVTATPVAFGAYDVFDPLPLTSTGSVEWSCAEPDLAIQIQLGPGREGTFHPRRMANGTELLAYNLYLDPAATRIWGDGTGGTFVFSGTSGRGPQRTSALPVYGIILPGQDVSPGIYTDSVVVTLVF